VLDQSWPLESVLLSEGRAANSPELVRDALAAGASVYTTTQDVFDRIAGYHVHRGVLALAPRPGPRSVADVTAHARLVVAAEGVNDHENVGALFRNAAAFGVGAMVLDPSCTDPLYRRAVRVSMGHVLRVPFVRSTDWTGDLSALRQAGFRLTALTPMGSATIDELAGTFRPPAAPDDGEGRAGGGGEAGGGSGPRWVVMVGAEGPGLSPAALALADTTVRIPMAPGIDSVNVATAAAIALHHLARFNPA
jgi:tRNA G18 (ribose-2'-O)-methylase SpoU